MSDLHDFVRYLHRSHLDNGRMVYYAVKAGCGKAEPVMPATPFIFEYFLFNSIYQHNWKETDQTGNLQQHPKNHKGFPTLKEHEQQQILLDYLQELSQQNTEMVQRAFSPFKHLVDLNGKWTKIIPDHNLNEEAGEKFFRAVRGIQDMLQFGISVDSIPVFFKHLDDCREFVGKVRNNIFHGAKSLSQIWEDSHRRRIELYHLFIQSLNSLFFLTRDGIDKVASDNVSHAIQLPTTTEKPFFMSSMKVLELQVTGMMKQEDPELISWANEILKPLRAKNDPTGAMFYPSAGADLITPVLIGLPFCNEFHFYDKHGANGWNQALKQLGNILGNPKGFKVPPNTKRSFEMEFEFAGVPRRILRIREDNENFLKSSARLIFFFHRGDSVGEGGADQPWDSELYEQWKNKISARRLCAVLTDATPHGLHRELAYQLTQHPTLVSTRHQMPYYCGIIHTPVSDIS